MNDIKGKNFSLNNVNGKRRKSDFYETPYSLTQLLLDRETMLGNILEPACGDGAIVKVLKDNGYTEITAYDKETNFLKETKKYDTVITNPPFSLAYEFIQKAKEVSENKIYMLLPLNYLHGKKRYDNIYQDKDFGLRSVYVFTRYPLLGELLRKDGKHNTGMMVYAWYVFQKGYNGNPEIDWLDNDSYILREGE
jgi:hypothetical protein